MKTVRRDKVNWLAVPMAVLVAVAMGLLGYVIGSRRVSNGSVVSTQSHPEWRVDRDPILGAALSIPSACSEFRQGKGLPEWPVAGVVTYFVPDRRDGYLLVATFRVQLGPKGEIGETEAADYRCLDLQNTTLVTLEGKTLREYRGVLFDKDSFAAAITGLHQGALPAEIRQRMAANSSPICSWPVNSSWWPVHEYDPYERYLPTEKPDNDQPQDLAAGEHLR